MCFLKKLPFWCEFPICLNRMMGATCVLPACFMRASCVLPSILLLHVTVCQHHYFKAKLEGNSHYFANFFRKHAGSTHGCYLRASFCCNINGSQCMCISYTIDFDLTFTDLARPFGLLLKCLHLSTVFFTSI